MAILKNSEIMEEFTNLKEYVDELKFVAEIIEENEVVEIPTLAILIPYENSERVKYQIYCNFLSLDEEDAEFTKYLHMYSELDLVGPTIPEIEIYKAINVLNGYLTIGSLLYKEKTKDQPAKIQYRYTLANTIDSLVDEGAFCESLFLTITNLGVVENVMSDVLSGTKIDTIIDSIMAGRA